ncbi:serine/threonine protein kinase Sgk2 [Blumeria hordei DH14]|uniref:EKC/KEOPS complex subunit BUD32 n=1 Tax=Blumeria graminis f. sp. hordei (strain DH14) TaxID=546991 RepID=N1JI34_BLUG1|nr:serine/threonine protein kinase Sgk2 [Blumeria hordei DH14]
MDQLSELFEFISSNPLKSLLDQFRAGFDPDNNPMTGKFVWQCSKLLANCEAISDLIYDLLGYARKFKHNAAIMSLQGQLYFLAGNITIKSLSVSDFADLIESVNSYASDHDIWSNIIELASLVNDQGQLTRTKSRIHLMKSKMSAVSRLKSAAEQEGYGTTTTSLTMALKSELSGNIFRDVSDFWEIYFENKPWSDLTRRIWESYRDNGQCGPDNKFTANMDETVLRSWLHAFHDRFLSQLTPRTNVPDNDHPVVERKFGDPHAHGTLDFFIESSDLADGPEHQWRDIRVLGEITSSKYPAAVKIHQMMRYVREVFYSQPLSRFVHGFCLHKMYIELWIADRAGAYSSAQIHVMQSQEKLVRGLASYMLMSDEELGLDPVISYDDAERCFVTIPDDNQSSEKIELQTSGYLYEVGTHREGVMLSDNLRWYLNAIDRTMSHGNKTEALSEEFFTKRKLTFAKLSPVGRPLDSSLTVREFVSGIRDAILGHRNLHKIGIVHGDVSAGNIILTGPDENGATKGMLIDLDMATFTIIANEKDHPKAITGTTMYMALELLRAINAKELSLKQTYRHDLESFFYVLIVGCMSHGLEDLPEIVKKWSSDSLTCFVAKEAAVTKNFETFIIAKFLPKFEGLKELARTLRDILFRDEEVEYGSPADPNVLYDPMIDAFKGTIEKLEAYVQDKKNNDSIRIYGSDG